MSEVVLTFPLAEIVAPLYQRVAPEMARMSGLGLTRLRIAQAMGLDDKPVAKGLRWLQTLR